MPDKQFPPSVTAVAPVRSLLMWSGGLDSTYSLLRLLEATGDEVHVHHVHANLCRAGGARRSRRCEYEASAVAAMLPWLREHCRGFEYAESRVDLSALPVFARDTTMVMFFAAQAALSIGLTPFDRIVFGVNADEDPRWQPDAERYALRRLLTIRMLKAVWEIEEVPYFYLWNPRPSKHQVVDSLPAELVRLAVSCRDPVARTDALGEERLVACGRCAKCRSRDATALPAAQSC